MRRIALSILIACAILAIPASASAATFCVAPLTGCDTDVADVPTAVGDAATTAGLDTIKLPAGSLPAGISDGGTPVAFVGSGPSTVVTTSLPGSVVSLINAGSSVSNLSVQVPNVLGGSGLLLAAGASADRVAISAPSATNPVTGITTFPGGIGASSSFTHGSVDIPRTAALLGSSALNNTGPTFSVQDSTISAPVAFTGSVDVRRTLVHAAEGITGTILALLPGATNSLIEDSTVLVSAIPTSPLPVFGFKASPGGFFPMVSDGRVVARHVTLIGDGSTGSDGVVAAGTAGFAPGFPGASGTVDLTNSVVRGFDKSISRSGASALPGGSEGLANVNVDYSDIDLSALSAIGPGNVADGGHNVNVDPKFTNPAAGDYTLGSGSPLIDAGDPAGLGAATTGFAAEQPLDEAGNQRIAGARTDIGAFEFQPPPPAPPAPVQQVQGTRLPTVAVNAFGITNKVFAVGPGATATSAAARAKKPKRGTVFSYSLSRDGKVTITITQKAAGHRKGRKCVSGKAKRGQKSCSRTVTLGALTRTGKAGANRLAFTGRIGRRALKAGSYKATIVAVDSDGGKSAPKSVSFRIVKG